MIEKGIRKDVGMYAILSRLARWAVTQGKCSLPWEAAEIGFLHRDFL